MNPLKLHQALYERTSGRIGHRLLGVPCLLLRTAGARTGLPRTNALVYARDADAYLVVASNGGADRAPAWLHNLRAQPAAHIQIGRHDTPVTATVIEPGHPDHPRLWDIVNANNRDRYRTYATKTERPIPVIALNSRTAPDTTLR